MFHKVCVFMIMAGISGALCAHEYLPQVVTSEVFFESQEYNNVGKNNADQKPVYVHEEYEEYEKMSDGVPAWPLVGSDADVEVVCGEAGCKDKQKDDFIGTGWTGGPDIMNGNMIPAGFDYECANKADMPLMRREMMEDDGGSVLAMSRSPRKVCKNNSDSYAVFAERAGFSSEKTCNKSEQQTDAKEVAVNEYIDEEAPAAAKDQVRSWVVANGQTLRQVLQSWCDKEGWDLVWTTAREYPIEASAVFKGRFVDVASALIRNFERATPIPYAKFYKGNRVIVVSTSEE